MAKTAEAGKDNRKVGNPTEPEIRAAMWKAIREVKRNAELKNIKLVVANKIVGGAEVVLLRLNWIDLPMGHSREATVTQTKNMKKRNPHIGANFDDFLKEENIFE
jgi:hypothetical protein